MNIENFYLNKKEAFRRANISRFVLIEDTRCIDPSCHWRMFITNQWSLEKDENFASYIDFGKEVICSFLSTAFESSFIRIIGKRLLREVSTIDWIRAKISKINCRVLDYDYQNHEDNLDKTTILCVSNDQKIISYILVLKNADHLFIVNASSPAINYKLVANDFSVITDSFRLINLKNGFAEPIERYKLNSQPLISFLRPLTWEVVKKDFNILSEDCSGTRLKNRLNGNSIGWIDVIYFMKNILNPKEVLIKYYKNLSEKDGCFISGSLFSEYLVDSHNTTYLCTPTGKHGKNRISIVSVILVKNGFFSLISMTSLPRDECPDEWAINKKTYEIIRDSLKIN